MIKKIATLIIIISGLGAALSFCDDQKRPDQNQLFYAGNDFYEKRDYNKAIEEYRKILQMGIESPSLYYNIGNSYFKIGEIGRAILFYERARRLAPQDADLKSNLAYAKSLVGSSGAEYSKVGALVKAVGRPFEDFNLNAIAITALLLYLAFIIVQIISFINRLIGKKIRLLYVAILLLFAVSVLAFALRYYDEEILMRAVILQKDVECKYEPIDKSMTYYRLQEGDEVIILKTRAGWSQVERPDGKVGWVLASAVEEI